MAFLNCKALARNKDWQKLNPSARSLLLTLAQLTDKSGFACYPASFLMGASGIRSKDTFLKGREELVRTGFIETEKYWAIIEESNKMMPRSYITYQITEVVLWKMNGNKRTPEPNSQSTVSESTDTRSVEDIYKKNREDKYTAKAVGNKKLSKGIEPVGEILIALKETPTVKLPPNYKEWQDHALRLANNLNITPNDSWFKVFKKAYLRGQKILLEAAASFVVDYPNPEDKKKLFYWKFHKLIKK